MKEIQKRQGINITMEVLWLFIISMSILTALSYYTYVQEFAEEPRVEVKENSHVTE